MYRRRFGPRSGGHAARHSRGKSEAALRGRLLSAGDMQLVILSLLAERPRHGYEIMKAVQARSSGRYTPSPGIVYPALGALTRTGHATVREDGAKKLYSLSDVGRAEVTQKGPEVKAVWDELAKARPTPESSAPGEPREPLRPDALDETIRDLKAALFDTLSASFEERERVLKIMRRAIADIRSK